MFNRKAIMKMEWNEEGHTKWEFCVWLYLFNLHKVYRTQTADCNTKWRLHKLEQRSPIRNLVFFVLFHLFPFIATSVSMLQITYTSITYPCTLCMWLELMKLILFVYYQENVQVFAISRRLFHAAIISNDFNEQMNNE